MKSSFYVFGNFSSLTVVRRIGSWLIVINKLMEIPCINKVIVSYRVLKNLIVVALGRVEGAWAQLEFTDAFLRLSCKQAFFYFFSFWCQKKKRTPGSRLYFAGH